MLVQHGVRLPNYSNLLCTIYQWLGAVYGELSMDVIDGNERRGLQNEALSVLFIATQVKKNDPNLFYQLGLQLAEAGEVILI